MSLHFIFSLLQHEVLIVPRRHTAEYRAHLLFPSGILISVTNIIFKIHIPVNNNAYFSCKCRCKLHILLFRTLSQLLVLNILNICLTFFFSVQILFHFTLYLNGNKFFLVPVNRRVAQLIHLLGTLAAGKTGSYTCNLYLLVGLCSTVKQFIVSDWTESHFQETFTAFIVKIFPPLEFNFHSDGISFFFTKYTLL